MKPREVERLVKNDGWWEDKSLGKGSHRVFRHAVKLGIVTGYSREIPPGKLQNILKAAGLK